MTGTLVRLLISVFIQTLLFVICLRNSLSDLVASHEWLMSDVPWHKAFTSPRKRVRPQSAK